MNQENKEQLNIPKLRFLDFDKKWFCGEIKDIGEVIGGGTPDTNIIDYWNGDINWFTPTEIKKKYVSESFRKISKAGLNKSSAKLLPPGTLLLTTRATIGDVSISSLESSTNQGFQSILVNKDNINEFFYYWILKNKNSFLKLANGSTFPEISGKEVKKLKIIYPEKKEQQKIANFLSSVDNWINNLKQQKENLESYKKGMMQKIFSREIRFKDQNGEDFEEWEEKKIKDIFIVTRGYVLSMNNIKNSKIDNYIYPVYSSQTMNSGLAGYYNEYLYENAITWTTDGANAGNVNFRNGKFYCTNVCGVLINKDGYANNFVSELLNSIAYKHVSRVGNPKLMNNVMSEIKIKLPCIEEQQKIANFLSSIDNLIEIKEKEINNAEEWKKGLMQQMFV